MDLTSRLILRQIISFALVSQISDNQIVFIDVPQCSQSFMKILYLVQANLKQSLSLSV